MNKNTYKEISGTEDGWQELEALAEEMTVESDMRKHFNNLEAKRQEKKKAKFNTSYDEIMRHYYEKAYQSFYIEKKWIKGSKRLLEEGYTSRGLAVPCDGLVETKEDAIIAVRYYKAFREKIKAEGRLTPAIEESFKRTIKKYETF